MGYEKISYNNEYNRQNYDFLIIRMPKGKKAELKDYASKRGESLNAIIIRAIEEYTKLDLSTQ